MIRRVSWIVPGAEKGSEYSEMDNTANVFFWGGEKPINWIRSSEGVVPKKITCSCNRMTRSYGANGLLSNPPALNWSFIHPFIQQGFIEAIPCLRPCGSKWNILYRVVLTFSLCSYTQGSDYAFKSQLPSLSYPSSSPKWSSLPSPLHSSQAR